MVDAAPNPGRPLLSCRCCRGRQPNLCHRRLGYRCRRIASVILLSLPIGQTFQPQNSWSAWPPAPLTRRTVLERLTWVVEFEYLLKIVPKKRAASFLEPAAPNS